MLQHVVSKFVKENYERTSSWVGTVIFFWGGLTFHIGVVQEEFDFDGDAVPETGFAGFAFY